MHPCIVWIRNDLRLRDNPALLAASRKGQQVIVCYIWSEDEQQPYPLGCASRAWLHDSLIEFNKSLNGKLVIRRGKFQAVLEALVQETQARSILFNRTYEPHLIMHDQEIQKFFTQAAIEVTSFRGNLLYEPWEVATKEGRPYKVFTPFYNATQGLTVDEPLAAPASITHYDKKLESESVEGLSLLTQNPRLDIWTPGEAGAQKQKEHFLKVGLADYAEMRDYPAKEGTSRLSAHLHFGEISVREIWHTVAHAVGHVQPAETEESYVRELVFREFAAHLLYHFPSLPTEPLRKEFANFPWRKDPEQLICWQQGITGFPIIDGGMRELLATGWMHNRVRMIVGSFLVKQLLLAWQQGAAWFWDKLFDADLANNSFNWQWVAGSGADAWPYSSIFNPILEGQKFDPEGKYVKHWVSELKELPQELVHTPWKAKVSHYPQPIVDLDFATLRAQDAFHEMNNGNQT